MRRGSCAMRPLSPAGADVLRIARGLFVFGCVAKEQAGMHLLRTLSPALAGELLRGNAISLRWRAGEPALGEWTSFEVRSPVESPLWLRERPTKSVPAPKPPRPGKPFS